MQSKAAMCGLYGPCGNWPAESMMYPNVKVRDCMATELVTLDPSTEILRAVHILIDNDIAGAPVVNGKGELVGMLTERNCIEVLLHSGYHLEHGGPVSDYMSSPVESIAADDNIVDAAKLFLGDRFHRYPVLDHGRLVGQVSRRDVMRALGKLWA
ncbi:MAG: CBS domain-containing protein [Pseudomonadota bacterium]